ncbi:PREDICTED: TRAF3-interacting JNK-activating modulator [Nanorana parkeri]|uniref:TRAF3-interacting JNK-activating modulator n=1 Tax=Nanorana parkeri TaxID=125878 RepID=UPI000854FC47|nr:PREDICTED: TRAF3-interacting JNK-activating modulator [Nanorana parkeri]
MMKEDSKDMDSCHHSRSKTYPFDFKNVKINILNNIDHREPLQHRVKKNDVPKIERGVQTVKEMPVICLKRDSSQQTDCAISVLNGELQQLSEYLMEALHREQKLKKKLCVLQELLNVLVQTSEMSWKAQLNEDKLKCKVANLENQLFFSTQNFSKTGLKKILIDMEKNKQKYEEKAKESLQKLTDDKIAMGSRIQNTQMSLVVSADECELWKEEYEKLKADWIELSSKHCELKNDMNILQSKLKWVTNQDVHLQQLQNHLLTLQQERNDLYVCNEQLQEDYEIQKEQLRSLQARLQNAEQQKLQMQIQINSLQKGLAALEQKSSSSITSNTGILDLPDTPDVGLQNDRLHFITEKLTSTEEECAGLKAEVELITEEYKSCQRKLQQCREELKGNHRRKPERRCSCWMPVLVIVFAAVTAYLFSTEMEHFLH